MFSIDEIAERIDSYASIYSILLEVCRSLGLALDSSPLYNFRDALAHYRVLYESNDQSIKLAQETSLMEHLSRGLRDGCYFILLHLKLGVYHELKKIQRNSPTQASVFRKLLHRYKELELDLRKPVIVSDSHTITSYIQSLYPLLQETRDLFQKCDLEWNFSGYIKTYTI
jgi:hypothetical protein